MPTVSDLVLTSLFLESLMSTLSTFPLRSGRLRPEEAEAVEIRPVRGLEIADFLGTLADRTKTYDRLATVSLEVSYARSCFPFFYYSFVFLSYGSRDD